MRTQSGPNGPWPEAEAAADTVGAASIYAAAMDDIDAAASEPNIDGRESVLRDLPKDLFVEGREDYEIPEEKITSEEIQYGRPGAQEIVHCHPDGSRKKIVNGIKDKRVRGGTIYLVTNAMLAKYPRLKRAAKPYVIRQCVNDEGDMRLWPAPLPGPFDEDLTNMVHL
jgi:hypothetical protein